MEFELNATDLDLILSALKLIYTPAAEVIRKKLLNQCECQVLGVAPVAENLAEETGTFDPRVLDSRNPNSPTYRPTCMPRVLGAPYLPTYKQPCGDKSHFWKHGSCTHYVYKDPADDGAEVDLIKFFRLFPNGAKFVHINIGHPNETPFQTNTRFQKEN